MSCQAMPARGNWPSSPNTMITLWVLISIVECGVWIAECRTISNALNLHSEIYSTPAAQLWQAECSLQNIASSAIPPLRTAHSALRNLLDSGIVQQLTQDLISGEVFRSDLAGGMGTSHVVGVNGRQGRRRFFPRGEGEEPLAGRDALTEAGVLGHYRFARGQIAHAAVAEPAAARAHVDILGQSKFSAPGIDVLAIPLNRRRALHGLGELPAESRQFGPYRLIPSLDRQFKRLGRVTGQVTELEKIDVLGPVVGLSLKGD